MIGSFAVGKTSLVARFVHSRFSEKYLSTVGVKVDRKAVEACGQAMNLVLWDIEGKEEFSSLQNAYLRGASGYLLVADGTRADTLDRALDLQAGVAGVIGDKPLVLLINKADLEDDWEIGRTPLARIGDPDWPWLLTSAKTGQGVEEAFRLLAGRMLGCR